MFRATINRDGSFTLRRPDGTWRRCADAVALTAAVTPGLVAAVDGQRRPFWAVMALIGAESQESGDWSRMLDAVQPRSEFPLPLWWLDSSMHGQGELALVGRFDEFAVDGPAVRATGSYDLAIPAADEAIRAIENGADGVSIDVSYPTPPVVECTRWGADGWCSMSRTRFPLALIGGATQVGMPAFAAARISLTGPPEIGPVPAPPPALPDPAMLVDAPCGCGEDMPVLAAAGGGNWTAGGTWVGGVAPTAADDVLLTATVAVVAAALALPTHRAAFFAEPDMPPGQPLTVSEDGRLYGYLHDPDQCHRGYPNVCRTAPQETDFAEFLLVPVTLDDGTSAMAGPLTFAVGHADLNLSLPEARAHYDSSASVAGLVTVGHNAHGTWYSGEVRPDITDSELWELTACGQVSGDWRPSGRTNRLIAVHTVPVPGFPQAVAASGAMIVPGPSPVVFLQGEVARLRALVARLEPLLELMPDAADAVLASLPPVAVS